MSMADFWKCSLWEFLVSVEGWNKAQGGGKNEKGKNPGMSAEDYDRMLERDGYR